MKELENLKIKTLSLEKEVEILKLKNVELTNDKEASDLKLLQFNTALSNLLTPGQIKRILNPNKKYSSWTSEDIASAISLRSVSPKAYRYLRKNGYPLPALCTLRRWALNLQLSPGILTDVVELMKQKSTTMKENERLCSLSFDEIYISNKLCIDQKEQRVLGVHKACQVVMVRGLCSQWKQPIFYNFDTPMTKNILIYIITQLHYAGYVVVSITSDMGTSNVSLWSELHVGHDKNCYFPHPVISSQKVFVFADIPHLLKLLRNHFIDQGFRIKEKLIDTTCIKKIISSSRDDLKIAHKINDYHLSIKGTERQKVRPAAQLLSNTVAKAVEWCGMEGFLSNTHWKETSTFIKLINDWFDVFNSQVKYGSHPGANAFGVDLEKQIMILNETSETVSQMMVGNHKALIPFQKGIVLSNNSLIELFQYLQNQYDLDYILTYKLNQDILENFFSYIRGMGATNDHPTAMDIKYRLRWYILGKHSLAIFSLNKNTEETNETCLLEPLEKENVHQEICIAQESFDKVLSDKFDKNTSFSTDVETMEFSGYTFHSPDYDLGEDVISDDHEKLLSMMDNNKMVDTIYNEGLKFIAGYVAYRFKDKYPNLNLGSQTRLIQSTRSPDWIEFLSRGNLIHPSDEMIELARLVEIEFQKFHKNFFSKEANIFNKLLEKVRMAPTEIAKKIPEEILLCLIRTRTYIKLRHLNKKISFENCKRKLQKKLSKFTNN